MTEEQAAVLEAIVEASRRLSKREPFSAIMAESDTDYTVMHPGLPGRELEVYPADLEELADAGMFIVHNRDSGCWYFDLSSLGLNTYSALKVRRGQPLERVEQPVRKYLSADRFRTRHPEAQAKWEQAEALLWGSDTSEQYTAIGHHCREAMQAFGTSLLGHYPTASVPPEPTATKARVGIVIAQHAGLGHRRAAFANELLGLWGSVVDLGQRQEHGAAKEGDPLSWADGHRLVLYTAFAMYELDRMLS